MAPGPADVFDLDRPYAIRAVDEFPDGSIADPKTAPRGRHIPATAFTREALYKVLVSDEWKYVAGYFLREPEPG